MSTYVAIGSVTLSSAQPAVTFLAIPQTYTDLIIRSNFTCDTNATILQMTFNSDSSSNYSRVQIWGNGSATGDLVQSNQTSFAAGYWQTGSGNQIQSIVNLMSYSNSSLYKSWLTRWNQVAGIDNSATMSTGMWRNTNAITSIKLTASTGNFNAGSTFDIYGINAANSGQAKATGGDSIYRDASYWYHVFTKSGTFTPSESLSNVDYLVVAGGGGGGNSAGGGGGAGGLRSTVTTTGGGGSLESKLSLAASTAYAISVGAGGSAGYPSAPTSGGNSSIIGGAISITSTGGGYGGGNTSSPNTGANGGSGGGSTWNGSGGTNGAGTGTNNQGYAGGAGTQSGPPYKGGGGGGAGGAGSTPNGGNGVANSITGSSINYAGGGGGGSTDSNAGSGGSGGGGNGGTGSPTATAGAVNSGGGGGGSGGTNNPAAGGSGIVIVRYSV